MRKLLFLLFLFPLIVHAPAWQWGRGAGFVGNGDENLLSSSNTVVTDAHGNVYIAGEFYGDSIVFGAYTLYNTFYDPTQFQFFEPYVLFLVKYDSMGNVLWAWSPPASVNNAASSLAIDRSGYIYMTGGFYGTQLIFGHDTLTNDTTHYSFLNNTSMFLAKFDESGNVIWARQPPASNTDGAWGGTVSADSTGNVYVTGIFLSTYWVIFGPDTLVNLDGLNADVFIAKYDALGNALWGRQSTDGSEYGGISGFADAAGNTYSTVFFDSSIAFGADTLLGSLSYYSTCMVKYNTWGDLQWAKPSTVGSILSTLTIDKWGNIFAAGTFDGTIVLGADTLIDSIPPEPDTSYYWGAMHVYFQSFSSTFIAKYDSSGNVQWADGVCSVIKPASLTTDDSGNVFLAGSFDAAGASDTFNIGSYTFRNAGLDDVLLAKYSGSGSLAWAATAGGTMEDNPYSVATDMSGRNVYITGDFQSPSLIFGYSDLNCVNEYSQGIFLAKLNSLIPAGVHSVNPSAQNFSLYPNPAFTSITVKSTDQPINQVTIINLLGQTMFSQKYNAQLVQVDVADFSNGIYVIRINGTDVRKFVKK